MASLEILHACIQEICKMKDVKLAKIKKHTLHCVLHGKEPTCTFYETQKVSLSTLVVM